MGMKRSYAELTRYLRFKLEDKYDNPMISITKTKRLLKNYCHVSYKKIDVMNSNKITP